MINPATTDQVTYRVVRYYSVGYRPAVIAAGLPPQSAPLRHSREGISRSLGRWVEVCEPERRTH